MPKSPSSVWPWIKSAVAGFVTITSGTPTCRASAHTWGLNRSPSGFTGGVSSAGPVKDPSSRSHFVPAPRDHLALQEAHQPGAGKLHIWGKGSAMHGEAGRRKRGG